MRLVQAIVLACEGNARGPEVFLPDVFIDATPYVVRFADVDAVTVPVRAWWTGEYVDAWPRPFLPRSCHCVVAPGRDEAEAGPAGLLDHAKAPRRAVGKEETDRRRARRAEAGHEAILAGLLRVVIGRH